MHRSTPEMVQQNQALTERITRAHGVMTAAMADLLAAVAEAERDESYWAHGSQTASEWLVANLRIHSRTARTWARVAKKLSDYPRFGELMAGGELGFDQIKETLRFVEPADQDLVAEDVIASTAEELESNARSVRRVTPRQVEQTRKERWFEGFFDRDEMKYHFKGSIPGQDGLVVDTAMRLLAWNNPEEPLSDVPKDPNMALADAFVEMASNALAEHPNHDLATVVVHADASLLALSDRVGVAEHGPDVPMEAIRRMTCDGRLQLVAHAKDGSVVGVGRVTRSIPPWLRRLVRQRDDGCRFPGCGRTYW
ncbi:MAG: DUF222 domain-containing protein, partial [bacterium]|nr:DUF222 domain-containing protein [bacterium]